MRREGISFDDIAKALKYSNRSAAYKAVEAAVRTILRQPAEELIALNLERYYDLLAAWYPRTVADPPDPQALAGVLKIMEKIEKWENHENAASRNGDGDRTLPQGPGAGIFPEMTDDERRARVMELFERKFARLAAARGSAGISPAPAGGAGEFEGTGGGCPGVVSGAPDEARAADPAPNQGPQETA